MPPCRFGIPVVYTEYTYRFDENGSIIERHTDLHPPSKK